MVRRRVCEELDGSKYGQSEPETTENLWVFKRSILFIKRKGILINQAIQRWNVSCGGSELSVTGGIQVQVQSLERRML